MRLLTKTEKCREKAHFLGIPVSGRFFQRRLCRALEIQCNDGIIAGNPGVMPSRHEDYIARLYFHTGPVIHLNYHGPRHLVY